MNDTPFDTIGAEPVEARIVAWVLGESSAFEAAELERLCEERPELLVFRRRMRALHGLLTEAEAAEPDHSWKLPPEKRKVLDEIFGEETVVQLDHRKELRIRRNGRRAILSIAACLVITFFVARLVPWKHEAEAIIEVKPRSVGMSTFGGGSAGASASSSLTPQFFGTEFEKIKSRNSLEKVVDNLDLATRWNMDKESAINRVKDSIETRNLDGTDLISIRVRDASELDAREITREVVESYKEYRSGIEQREAEKGLAELTKAIRDQEDKVEERRKVLATIVRTKGIIHHAGDAYYGQSGVDDDQGARKSLESYDQLLRDKNQLEGQINSLLKYDSDQLMTYASGLDLPDNVIRNVHPLYLEGKRHLEDLKIKGEGDNHPEVLAAENQIKAMKHQMDEGVVTLRETLKAKLDMASDSLKVVEAMKDDTREDAIKRGLDAQDYVDAKREFETDQKLLQSMKLKQINEKITHGMTEESIVVHEMPPSLDSKKAKSGAKPSATTTGKPEVAFALNSPAKAPEESLARNGTAPQFFDKEVQQLRSAPGQQPAPADAPAAPPVVTGKDGAFAMNSNREAGLKENVRHPEPAKQPATPESIAFADGAVEPSMSAADAPSEIEALPQLTTRSGLGGGGEGAGGPRDARPRAVPPSAQTATAAPAAEPEQLLAKDSVFAAGEQSSLAEESKSLGEIPSNDHGMSLADRFDTDDDVAGTSVDGIPENANKLDPRGVTSGLHSGDQAINRNSIDAILNNPNRVTAGAAKAKGIKAESDAKPPVLADLESSATAEPASQPAAADGALRTWGGTMPRLAEAGKKSEAAKSLGNDATKLADGDERSKNQELGELTAGHAQAVDQVRRNLYTAEGNYNLGNYDDAKKSYQDALRIDPYNSAARRGLEQVEVAKSDYYRASYDHSRAELLGRVDSAGELSVPADEKNLGREGAMNWELSPAAGDSATWSESKEMDMVSRFRGEAKGQLGLGNDGKPPAEEAQRIVAGVELHIQEEPFKEEKDSFADSSEYFFRGTDLSSLAEPAAADPFAEAKRTPGKVAGKELAVLKEREQKLAALRKQLEEPVVNDSKKQAVFKEWQKLQKEITEMTDEAPPAETDVVQAKLTDLIEEIAATENPYSTFSLNISDASFQLARAALAKGERPDPESIKPEQFYNAVDYGDPAPASNEPVAATIEQSAHPVIPGRNLVRVALRTGSAGRSAAQPLRLTLLVDQSGSMVREDRRASMEHALAQLGSLLTKADFVTVVGFSRTPHLLAESMTGDQAGKLGDLVNQTASEGGTNLEEAIKLGAEKALSHQLAGAQNRIVLFTDGAANLGNANRDHLAAQVKELRQKGLAFDIAGIGVEAVNDPLLSELARNGNGRYYVVGSEKNDSFARQLAGAFRPAAENVKVQVNFNPQRVGKYKLIGFEKDRLKTEDFRNDAVDAAELAAEEAGVAIYQVEPLAEGTGELGEVSVRFRDAASGEMVERAWTIPYAAQATAFDRATPSMQLAGLSLLAAEKLKGGPVADAIDFKQLTGPGAFVKQFYGSSPRVADMLRVIDSLK